MCEMTLFEEYLRGQKKAKNTISSYLRDVNRFLGAMKDAGLSLAEIRTEDIQEYVTGLSDSGFSNATITRCVASIKSFFQCMVLLDRLPFNPVSGVETRPVLRKLPKLLTEEEVKVFLAQPDTREPKGIRDLAMLETLYSTGLRASELTALNLDDVDLEARVIHCLRYDRDCQLPLYPPAVEALRNYLSGARDVLAHGKNTTALFVNVSGGRISRQGFWKLIKYYQDKAHLTNPVTPHVLRHTYAAHLLSGGVDLFSIHNLIGHMDYSSTQTYIRLLESSMKIRAMESAPAAMGTAQSA